ncbi:GntR family transcriptional regulator [Exiguobacterium profundum]|uniref:GntR family transcriptional regulator n=1 Tax=Exiguobacterium profundum TaxID=307643 RepID=A0ABY8AXY0_9BACL|nr:MULTISPECIES: GntR family transcriptional regulator [Exiguobacterium]QPI67160.1 GntR family transcriptional regulator [Exiguobacterium sp. PBE]MCT4798906.1 GntR family transcriptional regulator [Exiguobacterium profundum]MCV9901066.1 GntR family transcriptional regulator [Exiguobacterium sp. N5]MDT0193328.1 GntR family transcriptional regulator [Exiguobacterium sp. BG5(2022)]WED54747.1 GntR family transcriptional regulator [Exiguobacterium profundum]
MNMQFNTRTPVYLQVVDYFKKKMALGKLKAGDEMPSRRELANDLKINPNTVQKAFKEMEDQQLITTERNRPSRVTTDGTVLAQIRSEIVDDAVAVFVEAIQELDVSVDELVDKIKRQYKEGTYDDRSVGS